ncbi:MAG: hypothetical protein E7328_03545 [Clostridiales bacterium]|nr:hypothetical protein [Clostridiales bacterium]
MKDDFEVDIPESMDPDLEDAEHAAPQEAQKGNWRKSLKGFAGKKADAAADDQPDLDELFPEEEFDELFGGIPREESPRDEAAVDSRKQRTYSAIAYLTPIGAITALIYGRKDRLVRFHGMQSMAVWVITVAVALLLGASHLFTSVTSMMNPIVQVLLGTLSYLLIMSLLVSLIYCVLGAFAQVPASLPLIGGTLLQMAGLAEEEEIPEAEEEPFEPSDE